MTQKSWKSQRCQNSIQRNVMNETQPFRAYVSLVVVHGSDDTAHMQQLPAQLGAFALFDEAYRTGTHDESLFNDVLALSCDTWRLMRK